MVRLSILIPTIGRGPLARTLDSIEPQMRDGDECIVVGDVREGPLYEAPAIVLSRPNPAIWYLPLAESAACDWGHANLNAAMRQATGDYLTWTDDDDVYTDGALEAIRVAAAALPAPAPLLFRFQTHYGYVVPPLDCAEPAQGHISGQCLVVPNVPACFGTWTPRYEGDFDIVTSTLARWRAAGVEPVWRREIIGVGRP